MASSKSQRQNSSSKSVAPDNGNVDQIRDILFGTQMKDYEKKFSLLEERILQEVTSLKDDSNRRLTTLETYINREVEGLSSKIKIEKETRDESIKELAAELSVTAKSIEKKLSNQENETEKELRELRQTLLEQSNSLLNEIGDKHKESMLSAKRSYSELREDKVGRTDLSGFLTEIAMRLTDNSHHISSSGNEKLISKQ